MTNTASNVRSAPNESLVRGKIVSVSPLQDKPGFVWQLLIESVKDETGMSSFATNRIGQKIEIFVRPDFRHSLQTGDTVLARLSYQGDERGGAFFLVKDEVRKIS